MAHVVLWIGLALILLVGIHLLHHWVWQRKEARMLQRKFGDLPMFAEFFNRMQQPERHRRRQRKERIS